MFFLHLVRFFFEVFFCKIFTFLDFGRYMGRYGICYS